MPNPLLILIFTSISVVAFSQSSDWIDVQEAVYRYQIAHAPANKIFCLGTGLFGKPLDADADLLFRLREELVRPASKCVENSERHIFLVITTMERSKPDKAVVAATIYQNPLRGSSGFYKVEKENGRWIVKDFSSMAVRKLPEPSS